MYSDLIFIISFSRPLPRKLRSTHSPTCCDLYALQPRSHRVFPISRFMLDSITTKISPQPRCVSSLLRQHHEHRLKRSYRVPGSVPSLLNQGSNTFHIHQNPLEDFLGRPRDFLVRHNPMNLLVESIEALEHRQDNSSNSDDLGQRGLSLDLQGLRNIVLQITLDRIEDNCLTS